jgi:hypothetical protein
MSPRQISLVTQAISLGPRNVENLEQLVGFAESCALKVNGEAPPVDSPAWSPFVYPAGDRRDGSKSRPWWFVGIDMDVNHGAEPMDVAHERLTYNGLAGALLPSSTDRNYRIVVPCARPGHGPGAYKTAWAQVVGLLGLTADWNARNSAQLFFGSRPGARIIQGEELEPPPGSEYEALNVEAESASHQPTMPGAAEAWRQWLLKSPCPQPGRQLRHEWLWRASVGALGCGLSRSDAESALLSAYIRTNEREKLELRRTLYGIYARPRTAFGSRLGKAVAQESERESARDEGFTWLADRFCVRTEDNGVQTIFRYVTEEKDEVAPQYGPEVLCRALAECPRVQPQHQEWVAKQWLRCVEPIAEDPIDVGIPGDNRPALCRIRIPLDIERPTPAWDEFVNRLSDPEFFLGYIGSVLDVNSRSRQLLYIQGEGEDGKSTALTVLSRLLGRVVTTLDSLNINQFTASFIYGHRLVVISENRNPRLFMTAVVRQATSGDLTQIERKGAQAFSAVMRCKLIACGNDDPEITSGHADKSRLVLLRVSPPTTRDDPSWEPRLEAEGPAFLARCWQAYRRLSPHHGKIPVTEETRQEAEEASGSLEEAYGACFAAVLVPSDEDTSRAAFRTACQIWSKKVSGPRVDDAWMRNLYGYMGRNGIRLKKVTGIRVIQGHSVNTEWASL